MLDFPMNGKVTVNNGNRTIRFGAFEADLPSGEVRKSGSRIKLQDQPFKVLQILLEHPGDLVTRKELQSRIWPEDSFGDLPSLRRCHAVVTVLWPGWTKPRWIPIRSCPRSTAIGPAAWYRDSTAGSWHLSQSWSPQSSSAPACSSATVQATGSRQIFSG